MIRISKVPEGPGKENLRYDVQRWVYTQLGRLTGLQELILGVKRLYTKDLLTRNITSLSSDPIMCLPGDLGRFSYKIAQDTLHQVRGRGLQPLRKTGRLVTSVRSR